MLRLRLRGRDDQGHEARARRGVRLDRARQAVHDGDDGPLPGQALPPAGDPVLRARAGTDEAAIGTTTARPPWAPVSSGCSPAASHGRPAHGDPPAPRGGGRDDRCGAGPWRRPHAYGDAARTRCARCTRRRRDRRLHARQAARRRAGRGRVPRAAVPEPLRRHRSRAASATACSPRTAAGSWTTARSRGSATSTSTSRRPRPAPTRVLEWFEWWNAVWGLDVEIVERDRRARRRQRRRAAVARAARPRSSRTRTTSPHDAFRYLDAKELARRRRAVRSRCGSASSASSATSSTSRARTASTSGTRSSRPGARPFGLEAQRMLRLEKQHVIVGQDTDSESNLYSPGMPWLPSWTRTTSSGSARSSTSRSARSKERLVGFKMERGRAPGRGRADRASTGARRDASRARGGARPSARSIGLAWVPTDRSEQGTRVEIQVDRLRRGARITHGAVLRPVRGAAALVSRSRSSRRRGAPRARRRRRCGVRSKAPIRRPSATSRSTASSRFAGASTRSRPGAGEELVRLSPRRAFLFTPDDPADVASRVRAAGALAFDASGALAGIAIRDEQVMRRLTDLDLERSPTAGSSRR